VLTLLISELIDCEIDEIASKAFIHSSLFPGCFPLLT